MLTGSHEYAIFITGQTAVFYRNERQIISTGRADSGVGKAVTVTAKFAECLQAVIRSARGQGDYRNATFLDGFDLAGSIILGWPHGAGKKHRTLDRKAVTDILRAATVIFGKLFLPFIPLVSPEPLFHGQDGVIDIKYHQDPVFAGLFGKGESVSRYIGQIGCFLVQGMNLPTLPIHVHIYCAGAEGEGSEDGK